MENLFLERSQTKGGLLNFLENQRFSTPQKSTPAGLDRQAGGLIFFGIDCQKKRPIR